MYFSAYSIEQNILLLLENAAFKFRQGFLLKKEDQKVSWGKVQVSNSNWKKSIQKQLFKCVW